MRSPPPSVFVFVVLSSSPNVFFSLTDDDDEDFLHEKFLFDMCSEKISSVLVRRLFSFN